jgi:hypothetical protein
MADDLERRMKDEMERASLKELMPDFDNEREWSHLAGKLQPVEKKISVTLWRYAAVLIVLIGITWFTIRGFGTHEEQLTKHVSPVDTNAQIHNTVVENGSNQTPPDTSGRVMPVAANKKKNNMQKDNAGHSYTAKYMISNSTDCPMEISISQTMKCPNSKPAAISTSSTLAPGQSALLKYKANDSIPRNCTLTIEEIEIKSISTGEAITLDAHSSPSTAGEVFSYISGEKRGDVLAGIFNLDCNHRSKKHNLKLDNRAGNIIMQ